MADLTIQDIVEAGLNASYAAASAGGDAFENTGGNVMVHVKNGGASSRTVTVTAQQTSSSVRGFGTMTKANVAVAIPAGEDRFIGPFPRSAFNDAAGKVQLTYSSQTDLTLAALRLPAAFG